MSTRRPNAGDPVHLKPKPPSKTAKVNLTVMRITLFVSLVATGALGGYFSYVTLAHQERRLEEISFTSTTNQIEESSRGSLTTKVKSLHVYRVFLKSNCPTKKSWPNCHVIMEDFQDFTDSLMVTAGIDTFNHEVLVRSSELDTFTSIAADFYDESGYDDIADIVREGVFAFNQSTGDLYRVKNPGGGEFDFIIPIVQIGEPRRNVGALMYDIYSTEETIKWVDSLTSCVLSFNGTQQPANFSLDEVGQQCMESGPIKVVVEDIDRQFRPAAMMLYPMMLQVANTTEVELHDIAIEVNGKVFVLVGILNALFYWDSVLTNSVSQKTNGLDMVLHDGIDDHYFTFENGVAVYYPDRSYSQSSSLRETFIIADLPSSDHAYRLTVQVDDTFSNQFFNDGPIFASALFVSAIIFSIVIYGLYDVLTTRKWAQNDQAKRNFVRYISHELRTPLTTVSLGIKLVKRNLEGLCVAPDPSNGQRELLPSHSLSGPPLPCDQSKPPPLRGHPKRADSTKSSEKSFLTVPESDMGSSDDEVEICGRMPDVLEEGAIGDSLDVLQSMEGSVEVAALILTDLLDYDKIQNGSLYISCEYLTASGLVYEIEDRFRVALHASALTLVVYDNVSPDTSASRLPRQKDEESLQTLARPTSYPPLALFGDGVKLREVMRNLIYHAIKFSEEGGEITVSSSWEKRSVPGPYAADEYSPCGSFVVTVRDNGSGLSPENLNAVFSDGWQFKSNMLKDGEGAGLGMWITKNIVEAHNGSLTCHSDGIGKGCTTRLELPAFMRMNLDEDCVFYEDGDHQDNSNYLQITHEGDDDLDWGNVTRPSSPRVESLLSADAMVEHLCNHRSEPRVDPPLVDPPLVDPPLVDPPLVDPPLVDPPLVDQPADEPREQCISARHKVLVVDDSTMCRKMVCRLLCNLSYECIEAKNGQDFIDVLIACNGDCGQAEQSPTGQGKVDFVLLDFEMPVMDGPSACKILRGKGHTLPIIGLTGNVLKGDVDHFISCGANAVISKPFSLDAFTEAIKNIE